MLVSICKFMWSNIKPYLKSGFFKIGLPVLTGLALGVPVGVAVDYNLKKEQVSLEKIITDTSEKEFSKEQMHEFAVYNSLNIIIEGIRSEFWQYNNNLVQYELGDPKNYGRLANLAQAKQNLLDIGDKLRDFNNLLIRNDMNSKEFSELLYNANGAQQNLIHATSGDIFDRFSNTIQVTNEDVDLTKYAKDNFTTLKEKVDALRDKIMEKLASYTAINQMLVK